MARGEYVTTCQLCGWSLACDTAAARDRAWTTHYARHHLEDLT